MPYATVIQVANRNAARGTYTGTSIPNASQVIEYLQESAAQIDSWLYGGGYQAPFDAAIASGAVPTAGQILLQRWNVIGAALMVEEGAQQPINLEHFKKLWDEVQKAALGQDLPLPLSPGKAFPRGPSANPSQFNFARVPGGNGNQSWDL